MMDSKSLSEHPSSLSLLSPQMLPTTLSNTTASPEQDLNEKNPSRLDDCVQSIRRDVQQMEVSCAGQAHEIQRLQQNLRELGNVYKTHYSSWLMNYYYELQRQAHLRSRELGMIQNILAELPMERRYAYLSEYNTLRNISVPGFLLDRNVLNSLLAFDPTIKGELPISTYLDRNNQAAQQTRYQETQYQASLPACTMISNPLPSSPYSSSKIHQAPVLSTGSSFSSLQGLQPPHQAAVPSAYSSMLPTEAGSRSVSTNTNGPVMPAPTSNPNNSMFQAVPSQFGPNVKPIEAACDRIPKSINPICRLEHGKGVSAIASSRNSKWIVTGSKGTVKLWKTNLFVRNGQHQTLTECEQEIVCLEGHYVRCVQFAEQDTKLLIAGEHFLVEIWSINENKPFATLDGHLNARSSVYGLTLLSDGNLMCMATSSGVIEMWDIHQKELIKIFSGHTNTVSCVTVTLDNKLLVSGSLDGSIKVWDIVSGNLVSSFSASSEVFSIAVVQGIDGSYWVLAGLANSLILTANIYDANLKYCIQLHNACVLAVKFGMNGKWFISASKDGTLKCSIIPSGQMICKSSESAYVACCDISTDGQYVLSGGGTNSGMVYEVIY